MLFAKLLLVLIYFKVYILSVIKNFKFRLEIMNFNEVVLVKEGEIFLRGLNKRNFENDLIKNIKRNLKPLGIFEYIKAQSTITVIPKTYFDMDVICNKISKIFGIASFCRAAMAEKNFEDIKNITKQYFKDRLKHCKTFKVFAKRSDKNFSFSSPEICCKLGEFVLNEFPNLKVNLTNPDISINIEIRDYFCYIYSNKIEGAKGIPIGSTGTGMLLLSGGIDSPVAAFMMAKRGMKLKAVHFVSPPYTSSRALKKVEDIILILQNWLGIMPLSIVSVTDIQEKIKKSCPESLNTIILRRFMVRIAESIAIEQNSKRAYNIKAIVTGDSLAQVASQTLSALCCVDSACNMPILRPLIGMDKGEIVNIARNIGTFNTSILPYEDCCTVFTPKHPKTSPKLQNILKAEKQLDINLLIKEAIKNLEFKLLKQEDYN